MAADLRGPTRKIFENKNEKVRGSSLQKILRVMTVKEMTASDGFALYRLPYTHEQLTVCGSVEQVSSFAELSSHHGFVVAPFAISGQCPLLVIKDEQKDVPTDSALYERVEQENCFRDSDRNTYHIDFHNFHAHLLNGDFRKLVLSRSLVIDRADELSPLQLFQRACDSYPRMFISLAYTPQSGLWLTATPEILLAGDGDEWQTMALAGTMIYEEGLRWSDKNIQEQRYVATYIARCLEQYADDFREEGPYTARAGHLAHLRSDFFFSLSDVGRVGELIGSLHPTPAVCGLPKQHAFQFIQQYEQHQRCYYSGFMGPLFLNGRTHLFVTLRCMQMFRNAYRLYAGGGLLKDSVEEQEWDETETKLETMRKILKKNFE